MDTPRMPPPPRQTIVPRPRPATFPLVVSRPVERNTMVLVRGDFDEPFVAELHAAIERMVGHDQFLLVATSDTTSEVKVVEKERDVQPPVEPLFEQ